MNINCEKLTLKTALDVVAKAASSKSDIHILSNVLFNVRGNNLQLTAFNIEYGVTIDLVVHAVEGGSTTVSARHIADIVSNLPSGRVNIWTTESTMIIKCGECQFEIPTQSSVEYPTLPVPEAGLNMVMDRKKFANMIYQTAIAAADTIEARPAMQGVLLVLEPDGLTTVATDGKRLLRVHTQLDLNDERNAEIIVPARRMKELASFLGKEDGEVELSSSPNHLFIKADGVSFFSVKLSGKFPNYKMVIPESFERQAQISRDLLLESLRRMVIMAKDNDSPNQVRFLFQADKLTLTANAANVGSAKEELPIMLEGEPLEVCFNGRFITDALAVMQCDDVEFKLQNELISAVLRPHGDRDYDYVCMPIRSR